ncbi:MAG: BCD family MFS transporter [Spirulinaceae cyanobacterium]
MASSNLTNDFTEKTSPETTLPRVKLPVMFRLGLFQMGLGIMSVLTLGVLNRVMISELGIPATIAAGTLALHQFVAPARVWFGQMSDAKPIFGLHRTGYVWLGTALFGLIVFCAVQVMWQLGGVVREMGEWAWTTQTIGWTALLGAVFVLYGLALSASSTPFAALLVDVSDEDNRSKIVGTAWSLLMVGIVIGGISGGVLLQQVQQSGVTLGLNVSSRFLTGQDAIATSLDKIKPPINGLFLIVPLTVLGLAIAATFGIEKKYSRYGVRSSVKDREDSITLRRALRVLTASRQTAIFFGFLLVMTLSLFMQEAVLEPYGGDVFNMPIPETTQLNAFWGMGTLIGVSSTGFLIVPRLGKRNTTRLGCTLVAICFVLIILSGFTHNANVFKSALFMFGLATGITTTGAISLMLDLTAAETAGTFIGAWGLAQAIARALATVTGGIVLDIGNALFNAPVMAYGLVFGLQAIGMICAIAILNHVDVMEFKKNTRSAIKMVMEDGME